jgi:hypothetical protein
MSNIQEKIVLIMKLFALLLCMIILSCSKQENLQINSMHWELQYSGNKSSIRGIDALDENNAWLSGSLCYFCKHLFFSYMNHATSS